MEGLIFGRAHLRREIYVSKSIGLALLLKKVKFPFLLCFSEAMPIFFNRLKSPVFFSLSYRYEIFASNWLWIEICENLVLSKIKITMTIINKKL